MESHVYVGDVAAHEGKEALFRGWLYGKRSSGKLHFIQLRDGTGIIQCVVSKKDVPEAAILAVRHTLIKTIRDYYDERGFTLVDSPILTPAACEGTSTLFEVPYFDLGKAFLTQSGQLYGEAAAMAVGKAYVFGPTFRAEKSKTRRHLTEFWMVEPEVAWMDLEGDRKSTRLNSSH